MIEIKRTKKKKKTLDHLPSCCLSISNGHLHLHWWHSELRAQGLRLFLRSHSILVATVNQMTRSPRGQNSARTVKNQHCATLSKITSFCDYLFIVYRYVLEGHFNPQVFSSPPPIQVYLHNVCRVLAALFLFCHVCVLATPFPRVSFHRCIVSHLYFLPALLGSRMNTK